jgi:hypothetical protein
MDMPASYEARAKILSLKEAVISNFTEENWLEIGLLTGSSDIIKNHGRLLRSLRFGDPDYAGCALDVLMGIVDHDERYLATLERYLADKFDDGISVSSEPTKGARIYFSPAVFAVPNGQPDSKLVSVMMPFDLAFANVYKGIREVADYIGLACKRADDIWEHSAVIQDVFSLIFRSQIVVCEFTGRNPNVFYEAGIAHTLGKHVVPITQNADDIPFDLRHHRYVRYLNNAEGLLALQQALQDRFEYLIGNR